MLQIAIAILNVFNLQIPFVPATPLSTNWLFRKPVLGVVLPHLPGEIFRATFSHFQSILVSVPLIFRQFVNFSRFFPHFQSTLVNFSRFESV